MNDPLNEFENKRMTQSTEKRTNPHNLTDYEKLNKSRVCSVCEDKTRDLIRLREEANDLRRQLDMALVERSGGPGVGVTEDLEFIYQLSGKITYAYLFKF